MKKILVTGATGGIGGDIVRKFLSLNDLLNEFNSDLIKFFFLEKKYDHEIYFLCN